MAQIITAGEILVEIMAKNINQKFTESGEFLGPYPSGAPAIFTGQAAAMGVDSTIFARVGQDDFGRLNINRLKEYGADITNIKNTDDYTTGSAFVTYKSDGNREFIYHFRHSAAGQLKPEDLNKEPFTDSGYFHVMGCSLAGSESIAHTLLQAVNIARKNGYKISFDPNVRLELLDKKETRSIYQKIMETCDILLTGEDEFSFLTSAEGKDNILEELLQKDLEIIVIKKGSKGAEIYTESDSFQISPVKINEVDPTGAGDCFDAAFLSVLVKNRTLKRAGKIANYAGALSVTCQGPMEGIKKEKEILEYMKND